jgi:transcriptional antiterminator NusG
MMAQAANWYALSVRSRHEFVATEQLRKRGYDVFLPSVTRMRRWSDRNKPVTFPLFPGYLFVRVQPSAETFLKIVQVRGSVSLVSHEEGRPTSVDPEEMRALQLMVDSGGDVDLYPRLAAGQTVAVTRGPLKGASGILVKKENAHLFLVNINILGRSVGMQVDAGDLELQ